MRGFISSVVVLCCILVGGVAAQAEEGKFKVMCTLNPPFSFNKGLHMDGISVKTLEEIMRMVGIPFSKKQVVLLPWKQAYLETARLPKRIMLSVPRTVDLVPYFKWVGPIYFPKYILASKNDWPQTITSVEDASKYTVAAVRNIEPVRILKEKGMPEDHIVSDSSYTQSLLKLKKGEVDLMAHSDMAMGYYMKKMLMNPKKYRAACVYYKPALYFAFSKDTDDALILKLNKALESYKRPMANGDTAFDKMTRKYLPKGPVK